MKQLIFAIVLAELASHAVEEIIRWVRVQLKKKFQVFVLSDHAEEAALCTAVSKNLKEQ